MANIQNLKVIQDESGAFLGGVITPIDLAYVVDGNDTPKEVTGVYIKIVGTTVTEYQNPIQGTKFVTKVINPSNGRFSYLDEEVGKVEILLVYCCETDTDGPIQRVEITNTCEEPVHVSDCDKEEYLEVLERIYEAVDELELKVENINLNAETINLNTDEVEEKLDLLIGLSTPILIENKSYKITDSQTITFAVGSVFSYAVGIFGGSANYTEGGSLIGDYTQGESFGNGDRNNLILNSNSIVINALAGGDVRISVLQIPTYSPIIS